MILEQRMGLALAGPWDETESSTWGSRGCIIRRESQIPGLGMNNMGGKIRVGGLGVGHDGACL